MTGSLVVHELPVMAVADWSFRDSVPRWRPGPFAAATEFDPFPAYPHRVADVHAAVEHVIACWPPRYDIGLWVADREEVGRSNGFSNTTQDGHYEGDQWVKDPPRGLIVLSGKRVPPHPALTRYLVAHEYGHHVEWMLNADRGAKALQGDELVTEYAAVRGLPAGSVHHGSGGRWHDSAAEVFACDFRILVCGVEPDYWPHPGIPHPYDVDTARDWWAERTTVAA